MRLTPSIAILRAQSDARLVALAGAGSEAAFQAIVERYRRVLQRACRRVLSESRAEDAVQQAFMAAWVALQRGDDVLNLRSWLLVIARNTALNALRVPGYDYCELRESLAVQAAPQEELERREVMRQTLAGLAALPDRQRDALLRSAVAGVAYADIARDLGLSEGATRQLVLRARTTMRAAAGAIVPWPVVQWIGLSGPSEGTLRIAEIAAASGAGAAAVLVKVGVVAVVVGVVAAGPAVPRDEPGAVAPASAASAPAAGAKTWSTRRTASAPIAARRVAALRRTAAAVSSAKPPTRRGSVDGRREHRSGGRDDGDDDPTATAPHDDDGSGPARGTSSGVHGDDHPSSSPPPATGDSADEPDDQSDAGPGSGSAVLGGGSGSDDSGSGSSPDGHSGSGGSGSPPSPAHDSGLPDDMRSGSGWSGPGEPAAVVTVPDE